MPGLTRVVDTKKPPVLWAAALPRLRAYLVRAFRSGRANERARHIVPGILFDVGRNQIDFLEVLDGRIEAFECNLSSKVQSSRHASFFEKKYPESTVTVVSPQDCMHLFRDAYARGRGDDASLESYRLALESAARRS